MKDPKKKAFSIFSFVAGVFAVIGGAFTMLAAIKPFGRIGIDWGNTHGYDK